MSIPSWAKVGAKVVCISTWVNNYASDYGMGEVGPVAKEVYTIRAITDHWKEPGPCLLLNEIVNPIYGFPFEGYEACFGVERFRPVHTLRSDVRAIKSLVREMPASERLSRLEELLNEPEH